MIRRLRVFERKKKSGIAPTNGISPSSQSTPMLPAIRAICHFDMPRLRASQAMIGAKRRGGDVADDRDEVEDHVEPDRAVDAGDDEQPLEHPLHRLDPLPHRLRVGAEPGKGSLSSFGVAIASVSAARLLLQVGERVTRVAVPGEALDALGRPATSESAR